MSKLKMENKIVEIKTYLGPWTTKPVISSTGIFVAIADNTLSFNTFDSAWSNGLFFFMPKIIMILSKDHVPLKIFSKFPTVNISKLSF